MIRKIRTSALRLAKYSKSPIDYFLELSIGDFYAWVQTMNEEIDIEREMAKRAARKK